MKFFEVTFSIMCAFICLGMSSYVDSSDPVPHFDVETLENGLVVTVGHMREELNMLRRNMQLGIHCSSNCHGNEKVIEDLFWKPSPMDKFQKVLNGMEIDGHIVANISIIDLDETTANRQWLKQHGVKIICSFSAGMTEDWRQDMKDFPNYSSYLNISSERVRSVMKARLNKAAEQGCDAVAPDNVGTYTYDKIGLNISPEDQLNYNIFLSSEAHRRNLSIGLINDVEQIHQLVDYFDFAINEECCIYRECDKYKPFLDAKKAIFHIEYANPTINTNQMLGQKRKICVECRLPKGFTTLIKEKEFFKSFDKCD